ncbi:MAG: phenol hydroxylase [Ectothiorhodospiraceae bacterium]|nr:phenol hydroxylase [Ectothiorhodospiraceae bacterium]
MAVFNQQRFVRVTAERDDGFVEFDFSLGDPDLYVELILPRPAFDAFCKNNAVQFLSDEEARALDADRAKWREGGL